MAFDILLQLYIAYIYFYRRAKLSTHSTAQERIEKRDRNKEIEKKGVSRERESE
jgi:hypothetical protein